MSQVQSPSNSSSSSSNSGSTGIGNVDVNQFLSLMITELQNQDPLNPMSNSDFLQQISTIQQIGSTNQLTSSMDAVTLGQNVGIASSLIGKNVTALDGQGNTIQGVVQIASINVNATDSTKRTVQVSLNGQNIDVSNIRQIDS